MSHITHPEGAAPASSPDPQPSLGAKRVRVQHIARAKAEGIPLTMLTAYDALDRAHPGGRRASTCSSWAIRWGT